MPHTYRDRSAVEIALAVRSRSPNAGGDHVQEGDIVAVRRPGEGIGRLEQRAFIWLRVDGVDLGEAQTWVEGNTEGLPSADPAAITYEKRRYCIPLARLKQLLPSLDLARVRDRADPYQPFLNGVDQAFPEPVDIATARATLIARGIPAAAVEASLEQTIIPPHHRAKGKTLAHRMLQSLDQLHLFDWGSTFRPTPPPNTGGRILAPRRPLPAVGLIYDRQHRRYWTRDRGRS
jgi:hypothetical protein